MANLVKRFFAPSTMVGAILIGVGCMNPSGSPAGKEPALLFTGMVQTSSSDSSLQLPAYWKSGNLSVLPTGSQANGAAKSIAIAGNDIYITGFTQNGSLVDTQTPVYWKNGSLTTLPTTAVGPSSYGIAVGIVVASNGDIYVSGTVWTSGGTPQPVYWKNGTLYKLPLTGLANGTATAGHASEMIGFATDGTLVAMGDLIDPSTGQPDPVYWSNVNGATATVNQLTYGTETNSVGGHVTEINWWSTSTTYILGCDLDSSGSSLAPDYWVHGTLAQLPTGSYSTGNCWDIESPNGVDLYVTGIVGSPSQPVYWKNGQLTMLPTLGAQGGFAGGTLFNQGDFYISGSTYNTQWFFTPLYWKNGGTIVTLPTGTYVGGATNSFKILPD